MSLPIYRNGRGPAARPEGPRADQPRRNPDIDDIGRLINEFALVDVDSDLIPEEDFDDCFAPIPYDEWDVTYDAPFPFHDEPDEPPPPPPAGVTLKAAVLDLFRRKAADTMTGHTVWTHFHSFFPTVTIAAINASLFTLVDEGRLRSFRLPGRETFFDKGESYYSLVEPRKGGAR